MSDEIRCPVCRKMLAKLEDGVPVVRIRDRFRVVVRDGEIECLRCEIWIDPLTQQGATT